MISVDALLEFAVLEASAYEQRQLPPLNDLNQLYPASDFLKQKIHKIDSDEKRRQKLFMLKKAGKRITASIACLLAVFTCIFAPVEAVQDAVISTVIEWRDKFNQIIFSSNSELHSLPFGSNDALWTCHESGNNILTWADQNVLYQVTTAASLNEAIYIAENIEMG